MKRLSEKNKKIAFNRYRRMQKLPRFTISLYQPEDQNMPLLRRKSGPSEDKTLGRRSERFRGFCDASQN